MSNDGASGSTTFGGGRASAFEGCGNLQVFGGRGLRVKHIGASAFEGCGSLQHVFGIDAETTFDPDCFEGCSLLPRVSVTDSRFDPYCPLPMELVQTPQPATAPATAPAPATAANGSRTATATATSTATVAATAKPRFLSDAFAEPVVPSELPKKPPGRPQRKRRRPLRFRP